MSEIIAAVSSVLTASIGWVGDASDFVVETPVILFFVAIGVVGITIGWLKKFIPVGGKKKRR